MQENRHHFCAIALKALPIAYRGSFTKRSRSHDDRPPSTATLGLHRPTAAATTFFTASLSLVLSITPAATTLGSLRASYAPSSWRRVPSRRRYSGAVPAKFSVAVFSHSDWFLAFRAFPLPQQSSSSSEGCAEQEGIKANPIELTQS
ncbi:hypothetical protein PIB30_065615 [Stylosanthes scabra]|uniref:Uncharacterized protein n=1 Tax=Stylosanthes scabra TaxID=79078 RepID=A0ABU6TMB9_9FABA|nr:hypothetical protein [Stylosanthes scabra]